MLQSSTSSAARVKFTRLIAGLVAAGIAMVVAALFYLNSSGPLTAPLVVTVTLGVFLSIVLGGGLMAAGFYSSDSGHDDEVANASIHTGEGSSMRITVDDGSFEVYVARPAAVPAPVVIVLQEIFGVNADIRRTCDELAGHGFVAVAPDLFWRAAPGLDLSSWTEADWARGMALYQAYDLDRGIRDITALIDAARIMPGSSGRIGVMGFCLGGLLSFLTAARTGVDAAVVYYGGGTDQHLDEASRVTAPMLMHFGEEDEFISKDAQRSIKDAFAGMPNVEIHSYAGCSHAFARHTGTHYDAAAAATANTRTYGFFDRYLRAGPVR